MPTLRIAAARHVIALATLVIASSVAEANAAGPKGETDAAVDATIACMSIAAAEDRLACLDAAANRLKTTRIVEETETEAATDPAAAASADAEAARRRATREGADGDPAATFGAEALEDSWKQRMSEQPQTLHARIEEVRVSSRLKRVTLVLDNGQVWRQLDSDDTRIMFSTRADPYTVTIKRGAVGGYRATVKELGRTIRVRRVE